MFFHNKKKNINRTPTRNFTAGFTLVELLVSISIIAIIIGIVVVGMNSVRIKSRDAQRVSDLNLVQSAIEEYYDDNGVYPQCRTSGGNGCVSILQSVGREGSFFWFTNLTIGTGCTGCTNYMRIIPIDPLNTSDGPGGGKYYYYYRRGFMISESGTKICVTPDGATSYTENDYTYNYSGEGYSECEVGNPTKEYILAARLERDAPGAPFMNGSPNYFIGRVVK